MNITLLCTIVLTTNTLLFGASIAPEDTAMKTGAEAATIPARLETSLPRSRNAKLRRTQTDSDLLRKTKTRMHRGPAVVAPETSATTPYTTAIHQAAERGDLATLQGILTDTNINLQDETTGDTPLHIATAADHVHLVQYLLDWNADRKATNNDRMRAEELATSLAIQAIFNQDKLRRERRDIMAAEQHAALMAMVRMTRGNGARTESDASGKVVRLDGLDNNGTGLPVDDKPGCCVIS